MKKVAVVFPGLGSQYVGMGKELYDNYRVIQEYFEEAFNCQNLNFVKLCFASSDNDINQVQNAYLSLFLINSAFFEFLKEMGLKVDVVAGEDIAYFNALAASGGISFPDGLYLLNKIANYFLSFLDQNQIEVLEVKGMNELDLEKLIQKCDLKKSPLRLSYVKSEDDFLVVGYEKSIEKLVKELDKKEIKYNPRNVNLGLYSDIMPGIVDHIKLYLEKVDIKDSNIPVVSPIEGSQLTTKEDLRYDLLNHLINKFNLEEIINSLEDYDIIIEVGPKSKLIERIKRKFPEKEMLSFTGSKKDLEKIKEFLGENAKEIERVSE